MPLHLKTCPQCKQGNSAHSRVCTACGAGLQEDASSEPAPLKRHIIRRVLGLVVMLIGVYLPVLAVDTYFHYDPAFRQPVGDVVKAVLMSPLIVGFGWVWMKGKTL